MRFLLDHMVDHEVLGCLMKMGHEAFPIAQVGTADAKDDVVAVIADEKGAVVVTHDAAFARRQRRNTMIRMIFLTCNEWEASTVLEDCLDEWSPILQGRAQVVIEGGIRGYTVHKPLWT